MRNPTIYNNLLQQAGRTIFTEKVWGLTLGIPFLLSIPAFDSDLSLHAVPYSSSHTHVRTYPTSYHRISLVSYRIVRIVRSLCGMTDWTVGWRVFTAIARVLDERVGIGDDDELSRP